MNLKELTIKASREQTKILQAWFGSGIHAFDPVDVRCRTFTSSEVRKMYDPTYEEFGESKAKCADTLWDLYSEAMSTADSSLEEFTVQYTTD